MADTPIPLRSAVRPSGWFWSENDIFKRKVSLYARMIYLYLKRCSDDAGASFPSYQTMADVTGMSRAQAVRSVGELIKDGLLERRARTGGSSIFWIKSARVEPVERVALVEPGVALVEPGGGSGRATEGLPTEGRPTKDTPLTPHGGNGHVNGYEASAKRIIDFLNAKTGRNYQHVDANLKPIVARLKGGTTEARVRAVIARKTAEWLGTEWERHLNPETLFRPGKFAKYEGQLPATAFTKEFEARQTTEVSHG